MIYAAIDGWRRHMVARGTELMGRALATAKALRTEIDQLPGLSVMEQQLLHKEASHDLDRLQALIDVSELGISGYQVADWLRETHALDTGLSDHRRILATLSMADDIVTTTRLVEALTDLTKAAPSFPAASPVEVPAPGELELETVVAPRDAFFAPREAVAAEKAVGRISAEQVTPYPPGIPTLVPGERITQPVVDYLRSGLAAGMVIPDATDETLDTFVVVS
jgi:arginine/lysine/ornithine decarboxylase